VTQHLTIAALGREKLQVDNLITALNEPIQQVKAKSDQLKSKVQSVSIPDMFDSEMSRSIVSASNAAISSMARKVKDRSIAVVTQGTDW
jgi:Family of unknown function (DUF5407)